VRSLIAIGVLLLLIGLSAFSALAHESRPLYIEITERVTGAFAVQWRTPASVPLANLPEVVLPSCAPATPVGTGRGPGGPVSRRLYACADGLAGQSVEIRYPAFNPSVSTLLRVNWASGETHSVLASPENTSIDLPAKETISGVAQEYFRLGVGHILKGYDHLLFVACLVLIAGTFRRMLITVTGFTIAHSITLALAALELVRVPVAPVEATIALSIVFLATELVRGRRHSLTWRFPVAVSVAFGLLHGFGFASVLSEIGLPQTELPAALLFFNVGVEAGQIAFVVALVGAALLARAVLKGTGVGGFTTIAGAHRLHRPAGYVVGALAAFWLIERTSGFWA